MDDFDLIHAITKARDLIDAAFIQAVMHKDFDHTHPFLWNTTASTLASVGNFIVSESSGDAQRAVARLGDCVVSIQLRSDGHLEGRIAGPYNGVHCGLDRLRKLLPESKSEEHTLISSFWTGGTFGGKEIRRPIFVSTWAEIEANYALDTRRALSGLTKVTNPFDDGGLILWYGPPGTGKSYAVRALAWEWRSWAQFHYILDPDRFLADPGYMVGTVLNASREKYSVFVIEDAGDTVGLNNRSKDGLSALLNLTDGTVGQGSRGVFLFTTNLDISQVHPALARAGRCAVSIPFAPFSPTQAKEWLSQHGVGAKTIVDREAALSDLYAASKGASLPASTRAGFYL